MPSSKYLSILGSEWDPKTGDAKKLRVRFSVVDAEHFDKSEGLSHVQEFSVVAVLTRTQEKFWTNNDTRLGKEENLKKVLIEYAKNKIKQMLKLGRSISSHGLEIEVDTYYAPPNLDVLQIVLKQPEEIVIEKRFGFPK
jgi:hypothetical protein